MLPWIVKYVPQSTEIHQPGIKAIHDFLATFKKQKKKALLLHGPTGVGKTTAVLALAKELSRELVEVNASDTRNAEQINAKLGAAMQQASLFFQEKLILIDELDGLSGQQDRGGASAIADLVKATKYPVIMTANDAYDQKLSGVRKLATLVEFPAPATADIVSILTKIALAENVQFDEVALKTLGRRCAGDIRGAIIDLQVLSCSGKITCDLVNALGERDREENMLQALTKILKQSDPLIALSALEHVDQNIDDSFSWIDANMPKEYTKPEDRARALDILSKADVFRGRIRRWQYWRFLAYVNDLMTAGVAVAKDAPYRQFVTFEQPQRGLKYWIAKQRNAMRKAIAEKVAEHNHCSLRRAMQDIVPFLPTIAKHYTLAELKLEDEEAAWVKGLA